MKNPDSNYYNQESENRLNDDQQYPLPSLPKILIVGVGGAGNNCVNELSLQNIVGVETVAINTDHQHLGMINADRKTGRRVC